MGSWAGLMIRCGDDASLARVRARFTTARHGDKWPFAVVSIDGTQRKHPADVAALSAELDAEVILLVFTSVTDSIQYTRSVGGRVARHLQYGMWEEQGIWESVEGTPEPWERDGFYGSVDLEEMLELEEPAKHDEYRAMAAEGKLVVGLDFPRFDVRDVANVIADHHGLPQFETDWGPLDERSLSPKAIAEIRGFSRASRKPWWKFW